jgi:tetratricopeptide (TPR) repeat protein
VEQPNGCDCCGQESTPAVASAQQVGRHKLCFAGNSSHRIPETWVEPSRKHPVAGAGLPVAGFMIPPLHVGLPKGIPFRRAESRRRGICRSATTGAAKHALSCGGLGTVRLFYDWDWPGAEKGFLCSLELNPNLPEAHLGYASYLATIARFDESHDQLRTAYLLDPLSVSFRLEWLCNFYVSRRYEKTLQLCRKIKALPPDFTEPFAAEAFVYAHIGRFREAVEAADQAVCHSNSPIDLAKAAQAYAESGKKEQARRLLQQLLAAARERFVCGYNVATVYAALGEPDQAFSWLEEGIRQRSL